MSSVIAIVSIFILVGVLPLAFPRLRNLDEKLTRYLIGLVPLVLVVVSYSVAGYLGSLTTILPNTNPDTEFARSTVRYDTLQFFMAAAVPVIILLLLCRSATAKLAVTALAIILPVDTCLDAVTLLRRGYQWCSVCCQGTVECPEYTFTLGAVISGVIGSAALLAVLLFKGGRYLIRLLLRYGYYH